MKITVEDINSLVKLGEEVSVLGNLPTPSPEDVERFIAALDAYLERFEKWQAQFTVSEPLGASSGVSEAERTALKSALENLSQTHSSVLTRALAGRERLTSSMGEIRRRAQALRTYVDRLPSRITIAGKREG